jgi:hypothetical protein
VPGAEKPDPEWMRGLLGRWLHGWRRNLRHARTWECVGRMAIAWSYLACRTGRLAPILQPCIGSAFHGPRSGCTRSCRYGFPAIIVTENGVDVPKEDAIPLPDVLEDTFRVEFYKDYLREAMLAIEEDGVDLQVPPWGRRCKSVCEGAWRRFRALCSLKACVSTLQHDMTAGLLCMEPAGQLRVGHGVQQALWDRVRRLRHTAALPQSERKVAAAVLWGRSF